MTVKKKLLGLSKTKKMMYAGVAVLVVGGVGGTVVYANNNSQNKVATETQAKLDTATDTLSTLNKKIQALFDSKDKNYLAKDVTEQQVNDLKVQVAKEIQTVSKDTLSENKVLDKVSFDGYDKVKNDIDGELKKAESISKAQTTINGLFKQDEKTQALNGTDINKELPIADSLKKETIDTAKKDLETKKEANSFEQTVNELLKNAEDQVNQIEKAKTEVAKVYKEGKVTSTDKKAYETAKKEVDKIKNDKVKKELSDQLGKVKADSDKKEKAEANKKSDTGNSNAEAKTEGNATADATQANQPATNGATGGATSNQEPSYNDAGTGGNADTGYAPSYNGNGNQGTGGGGYTPPADNGATGGGNQGGSSSTGGGQKDDNVIDNPDIQDSRPNDNNGDDVSWGW